MRDEEMALQGTVETEFRKEYGRFWDFAQNQMNENRNDEFALTRELVKLTAEVKALQGQVETAEQRVRQLERETGLRNAHVG